MRVGGRPAVGTASLPLSSRGIFLFRILHFPPRAGRGRAVNQQVSWLQIAAGKGPAPPPPPSPSPQQGRILKGRPLRLPPALRRGQRAGKVAEAPEPSLVLRPGTSHARNSGPRTNFPVRKLRTGDPRQRPRIKNRRSTPAASVRVHPLTAFSQRPGTLETCRVLNPNCQRRRTKDRSGGRRRRRARRSARGAAGSNPVPDQSRLHRTSSRANDRFVSSTKIVPTATTQNCDVDDNATWMTTQDSSLLPTTTRDRRHSQQGARTRGINRRNKRDEIRRPQRASAEGTDAARVGAAAEHVEIEVGGGRERER